MVTCDLLKKWSPMIEVKQLLLKIKASNHVVSLHFEASDTIIVPWNRWRLQTKKLPNWGISDCLFQNVVPRIVLGLSCVSYLGLLVYVPKELVGTCYGPRIMQWELCWQNHKANPSGSHSDGGGWHTGSGSICFMNNCCLALSSPWSHSAPLSMVGFVPKTPAGY